jgi:hypothetical protein
MCPFRDGEWARCHGVGIYLAHLQTRSRTVLSQKGEYTMKKLVLSVVAASVLAGPALAAVITTPI